MKFYWLQLLLMLFVTESVIGQVEKNSYRYADTLELDFYSQTKVTEKNRPLLLLVHGGGFSVGKRDNPLETAFCEKMASKGYAVASISYRLTRKGKPSGFGCDCPTSEKMETFVAVSEDIQKAVGWLNKKSEQFMFNKESIILIGSSAGAEGVLNSAFMQDHYLFKHIPKITPVAVISFAGAMINANYITDKNSIPTLLFHGKKDDLVPYGTAPHHFCDPDRKGYIILDGSNTIAEKLKSYNQSYVFVSDDNGNHEWSNKPYTNTDLIDKFIRKYVLEDRKEQTRIDLTKKE